MRFLVCLLLLATLLVPTTAFAVNDSTSSAMSLDGTTNSAADTLVGSSGGAYRYYVIAYPGGAVPVTVTVHVDAHKGQNGLGFKVYGPSGLVGEGIISTDYVLTISNIAAGTYYVQVYNYIQGLPVAFTITVTGLPSAAQAAPPPASTSPEQPAPLGSGATSLTTGGTLAGQSSGSFVYYDLDYAGAQQKLTITLGYSPLAFGSGQSVGFNLYRVDGGDLVGTGTETGRDATSATVGFTFQGDAPEHFLLQVFNYLNATEIQYTLIVEGLSGPVATLGDISSPSKAFVLDASSAAARGELVGDPSGRFGFLLFKYPGGSKDIRITLVAEANAEIGNNAFGMNFYDSSGNRVGTCAGGLDSKSRRVCFVTINQADPMDIGVQVYNYSNGATAKFTIRTTGW